ncbi:MAG: hypothetical protein AAF915_16785 [Cyanobacteria bacterium P01_D01_bin.50]
MTQSKQALINSAKQGDLQAIHTLINHLLRPKGIIAKVGIKDDFLQILLESQEPPQQKEVIASIRNFISNLKITNIDRVKVFARKRGEDFPLWNTEFEIITKIPNEPPENSLKSSLTPQASEQQKIEKSQAYEYGFAGAVLGLLISFPSVWAALQMFQIQGGGSFGIGYIIGIAVIVLIGFISGFSQGLNLFNVKCPDCNHNFVLSNVGGNCPACNQGLYINQNGDCCLKIS